MSHALQVLEEQLRRARAPRPPDLRGSKMNQSRRRTALEAWRRQQTGFTRERLSQELRDRRSLGAFHPWITAARAEASAVARVAKAQASLRRARVQIPPRD